VLKEDAVAATDGPLAIAKRIVREADARSGIDPFILHAAGFNAFGAALDDPIEEIAGGEIEKLRIVGVIEVEVLRRIPSQPSPRAKAELLIVLFLVTTEQTPAESEIECEFLGNAPVILKKGSRIL